MKASICGLLLCACTTLGSPAWADTGYFSGEQGARASGRAGAFAAKADDVSAIWLNPAGLAHRAGTQVQIGNRFSYNFHEFERQPTLDWGDLRNGVPPYVEFAGVENEKPWQLLDPLLGVSSDLGLEAWTFGIALFAPAGIARQEFPAAGPQRYMMVRREAMILNYAASAAWHHRADFGVGATLEWIHVPRLTYSLVIDANQFPGEVHPVAGELDMLSTVTGSDPFTFNAILGAWYRPAPSWELALAGQVVPAQIQTDSRMTVEPMNPEVVESVELRRGSKIANDVSVTLPLPLTARAGVRYFQMAGDRELFDIELDVTYESWSRADRFTVDGDGLVAHLLGQRVNVGLIEVEKRWRDTVGVHVGGDYAVLPELLTLRAGAAYESAVAARGYAHIDFSSGAQISGALGASFFVARNQQARAGAAGDRGVEIAFAYQYRHQPQWGTTEREARVYQEVPGSQCPEPFTDPGLCHPQYLGRPSPPVNAGVFRAFSHVAALDVIYRF